jgi:3-oxoacyl-[acyl-carrier protein] reductase
MKPQNILITGASRGLGLALVKKFLALGYCVIGTGRAPTPEIKEILHAEKTKNSFHFESLDLLSGDLHAFVRKITKEHGHLYGLINNAALGLDGVLATMHETDISKLLRVNVEAPILLAKYAARSMLLGRAGRIINISSIIADTGYNGLSVYGATKAALIGLTKSLARELGQSNITVNAVAPGFMATEMTKNLGSEKLASIIRRSPLKRLATVEEVADGVAYLMGPAANSITGITLTIDGGNSI